MPNRGERFCDSFRNSRGTIIARSEMVLQAGPRGIPVVRVRPMASLVMFRLVFIDGVLYLLLNILIKKRRNWRCFGIWPSSAVEPGIGGLKR